MPWHAVSDAPGGLHGAAPGQEDVAEPPDLRAMVAFNALSLLATVALALVAYLIARAGFASGSGWLAFPAVLPITYYVFAFFLRRFWVPPEWRTSLPAARAAAPPRMTPGEEDFVVHEAVVHLSRVVKALVILFVVHLVARAGLAVDSAWVQGAAVVPITVYVLSLLAFSPLARFVPASRLLQRHLEEAHTGLVRRSTALFAESMVLYLLAVTELFAAWTAFWFKRGWVESDAALDGTGALAAAERFFAWHVADAIPTFEVPQTLHWSAGPGFSDALSGAFLLTYKAVVILPLLALALVLLRAWLEAPPAEARAADARPAG